MRVILQDIMKMELKLNPDEEDEGHQSPQPWSWDISEDGSICEEWD